MPAGRSVTEWTGMNAGQEVLLVGCSLFLFNWAKIPAGIASMSSEGYERGGKNGPQIATQNSSPVSQVEGPSKI